jgi:hypothetical protein
LPARILTIIACQTGQDLNRMLEKPVQKWTGCPRTPPEPTTGERHVQEYPWIRVVHSVHFLFGAFSRWTPQPRSRMYARGHGPKESKPGEAPGGGQACGRKGGHASSPATPGRRHRACPDPNCTRPRSRTQSNAGGFPLVIWLSSAGVQKSLRELCGSQVNEFLCDLFHRAHTAGRARAVGVPRCDIQEDRLHEMSGPWRLK